MSKHTPGPWKVVQAIETWMIASCGDGLIIQSPPMHGDSLGLAENDARLIAAAPEMLIALKSAIAFLPENETKKLVIRAIEKAEGS